MATTTIEMRSMHTGESTSHDAKKGHYWKFALMIGLSFIAMYILMYAMVDGYSSVYNNINQFYMAGLMAAPMAIIEIVLMSKMYPNKKLNRIILGGSVVALGVFWFGIRSQLGVGDQQFLRSMIPHHSGAILMCTQAKIDRPEIANLCRGIVEGQKQEIEQMKALLR